jgi:hypothetical protein
VNASVRKRAALAVAVSLGAIGCGIGEPTVVPFELREEIPLGVIQLEVTDWDEVRQSISVLSTLHPPEGEKPILVFVRWRGLDDYEELDRRIFVEAFLSDRLTLVDSEGFEYDALTAMPEAVYRMSSSMSPVDAPPNWVVVFWAWVDSEGYSLRFENPTPEEGGFDVAVVDLP